MQPNIDLYIIVEARGKVTLHQQKKNLSKLRGLLIFNYTMRRSNHTESMLLVLFWIFCALTLFGLYRPWLALWWLSTANRKKVIQIYGTITIIVLVTYLLITK